MEHKLREYKERLELVTRVAKQSKEWNLICQPLIKDYQYYVNAYSKLNR